MAFHLGQCVFNWSPYHRVCLDEPFTVGAFHAVLKSNCWCLCLKMSKCDIIGCDQRKRKQYSAADPGKKISIIFNTWHEKELTCHSNTLHESISLHCWSNVMHWNLEPFFAKFCRYNTQHKKWQDRTFLFDLVLTLAEQSHIKTLIKDTQTKVKTKALPSGQKYSASL